MTDKTDISDDHFDVQRRFIRIVEEHDNGIVELEFAVGEPQLFVEMVLPRLEFEQFCREQGVEPTLGALSSIEAGGPEQEWAMSLRDARDHQPRQNN